MDELQTLNVDTQTVSARELHEKLNIETPFRKWFPRMCEYGFTEGTDFNVDKNVRVQMEGGREVKREIEDYNISIDMAKEICMIQRTPEGKKVRQYLIELEKAWNTPEQIMARALKMADNTINSLKAENRVLIEDNERMKPKEIFADAVTASDSSILVRELAKMIKQNGKELGEKRLYRWMRENGYICKGKNNTEPTQRAMELGLFERVIRTIQRGDGLPLEKATTRVTGKGQQYFINKFLGEEKA